MLGLAKRLRWTDRSECSAWSNHAFKLLMDGESESKLSHSMTCGLDGSA